MIKGTTLVEAIIASVILLTVSGISALVVSKSLSTGNKFQSFKVINIADSLRDEVSVNQTFVANQFIRNGWVFTVTFSEYPYSNNLVVMEINANTQSQGNPFVIKYLIAKY